MIYFDNNATTPLDPGVLQTMMPYLGAYYGNAASRQHQAGVDGQLAVNASRNNLADTLGVEAKEIIFTSGATESCNLAIKGVFGLYGRKGGHIVTLKTEHKSVLDCCNFLSTKGAEITYLDVDANGMVDLKQMEEAIRDDTILVIAMWANNETGLVLPIAEIGKICARKGTLLFSDATQAVGKIGVKPKECGVQLLAFSGHKCYGPKGVGALYVSGTSPRVKLEPQMHGGGHEGGERSGTLNVPGIVGLARAVEMAWNQRFEEGARLFELRQQLEAGLLSIDGAKINGGANECLPHVANIRIDGVDAVELMKFFQNELAVASGSACTAADPDPSHVLMAMGLSREEARASLRFSLGRQNTGDEVRMAIEIVKRGIERIRSS